MTGKGGAAAEVFETAAKKLGPALGKDFSAAYTGVLHNTADGLERNAARAAEHESTTAKNFDDIHPKPPTNTVRGGGSGTPKPSSSAGSSSGNSIPLNSLGHPHAESTPAADRPSGGDPVDLVTGEMFLVLEDLALPGVLPLRLERTHLSNYRKGRWFGRSWASSLDQRVEVDEDGIHYAAADGVVLHYPVPAGPGLRVLPAVGPAWPLSWEREGQGAADTIVIEQPESGLRLSFPPGPTPELCRPLAAVADRNGNRVMYVHDHEGIPTDVYHTGGYHVAVESVSTSDGSRISALDLIDPRSGERTRLASFEYDARGRLTDTLDAEQMPAVFTYDDQDRITSWTDRVGRGYQYHYDTSGRVVRTDGTGGVLAATFAYDLDQRITTLTDSLGRTTQHHWNEHNRVVKVVDSRGGQTLTEWDRHGRVISRTDPLGRALRVHRDESGDPVRIEQPDGAILDLGFAGAASRPTRMSAPDGREWQYTYDERDNLTAVTDPVGAVTRYEYDERGGLAAVTDPLGQITRYRNDKAGLPVAVVGPHGAEITAERDAFGRVIAVTDPLGAVVRSGWTALGRRAWRELPDGGREEWAYDAEGNLTEHRAPDGASTRFEYGPFDEVVARTDPSGKRFTFDYDTELRLVAVTGPHGRQWKYTYGPDGELLGETDFNGRTVTYAYDAAGTLVEQVNGAGQRTVFVRDEFGRTVEWRAEGAVYRLVYDAAGHIAAAHGPDSDIEYTRDPLGRVLTETVNGRTTAYEYDALGRVLSRTTPSGVVSRWTYDAVGRPAALSAAGHTLDFHRTADGRETGRTFGASAAVSQSFDVFGRLTAQALWSRSRDHAGGVQDDPHDLLAHRVYSYRADGTPQEIADQTQGSRRFELDPEGRITAVHAATWTERYAYDGYGNLTHATGPGDEETQGEREYAGTLIRRAGRTVYEHDAQGRMVSSRRRTLSGQTKQWTYSWDAQDRLTAVVIPDGTTWQYSYDALGRRIAKRQLAADGKTLMQEVWFSWDGAHLAEQTAVTPDGRTEVLTWDWEPGTYRVAAQTRRSWAGAATAAAATDASAGPDGPDTADATAATAGPDGLTLDTLTAETSDNAPSPSTTPEQQAIDTAFFAIVTDPVGTPTELLSADGRIAWRNTTNLWGAPTDPASASDATTTTATNPAHCPLRFPGQYHDAETGLHYNLLRYYDPATGGYISPDPLGLVPAPNQHAYVANPLTTLDPLGLMGCFASKPVAEDDELFDINAPDPQHAIPPRYTTSANRPQYVYRFDTRLPSEIGPHGFTPQNPDGTQTLWTHVTRKGPDHKRVSNNSSQWISTGGPNSMEDSIISNMTTTHHLYRIDTGRVGRNPADVNATFGNNHNWATQHEYAYDTAIPPQALAGHIPPGTLPENRADARHVNFDNLPEDSWNPLPGPSNSGSSS